jgi:hypothetical protein
MALSLSYDLIQWSLHHVFVVQLSMQLSGITTNARMYVSTSSTLPRLQASRELVRGTLEHPNT